jgi:hypothetical protein
MSARRAAMRRERLQRNKIDKKKCAMAELERAKEQGIIDGRAIGVSACLEVLHSKYKFSNNKAQQLLNVMGRESARLDDTGVRFVANYYAEKFEKKLDALGMYQDTADIATKIYCASKHELFVTSVTIVLMVLNELWNFSSNDKNTGRLDYIMEYCTNRYLEMQLDPDNNTAEYYFERMLRRTGYKLH